jgi:hypothetical protein
VQRNTSRARKSGTIIGVRDRLQQSCVDVLIYRGQGQAIDLGFGCFMLLGFGEVRSSSVTRVRVVKIFLRLSVWVNRTKEKETWMGWLF